VADYYIQSLPNHRELELAGVCDRDEERCRRFSSHYGVRAYGSYDELLDDTNVDLVVNLTNPRSHFEISKMALERGKHVYSEKPLSKCLIEATELVALAEKKGLLLASAPCNVLSETAQTAWKALRDGRIGRARLAYAQLDDSVVLGDYKAWVTESGAQWPFEDEFETGCTLEHVGYYLGWLTAFFGPAIYVASFGRVLAPEKGSDGRCMTPDFTVGNIEFESGMVARITCSFYPPRDHSLKIFGDKGVLTVDECWNYGAKVFVENRPPRLWREKHPRRAIMLGIDRPKISLLRKSKFAYYNKGHRMDVSRGIAELAQALLDKREPRLSARWSLHVNELALAISNGYQGTVQTTFKPMQPMSWAC
jgi:predicted dehydrogenase